YRMTALLGQNQNIDLSDEQALLPLVKEAKMEMRNPIGEEHDGRLSTVFLNDQDVSWKIRTEQVGLGSSQVAQHPKIREELVKKQQKIAARQDVVMEGRDITYAVLPNAQMKIFLTASDIVRAKRRHHELLTKGVDVSFDEVYHNLGERDRRDQQRGASPLKIVPEAWVIDSSDLSISQTVDLIVSKAELIMSNQ
ncbi:MAG: (d)CMP kinase, partial [Candidatus Pacebacteria bacterium]|nr:(d)CMP kinase [Candidatus Paceibacterota bacterium]